MPVAKTPATLQLARKFVVDAAEDEYAPPLQIKHVR
jgi:hypothetical protein